MTTAKMASNSVYMPIWLASDVRMLEAMMSPAMPAQKPQKAYAKSFTRRSLMPL